MLYIPPKIQNAFDQGNFEPVIYAEFLAAVRDADSPGAKRGWAEAIYKGTQKSDEGVGLVKSATQTGVLVQQAWDNNVIQGLELGVDTEFDVTRKGGHLKKTRTAVFAYQTFTVGEHTAQATHLKKVWVRVTRTRDVQQGMQVDLTGRLYAVDATGTLARFKATLNLSRSRTSIRSETIFEGGLRSNDVVSLMSIPLNTDSQLQFGFDEALIPGQKYAFMLTTEIPLQFTNFVEFSVFWKTDFFGSIPGESFVADDIFEDTGATRGSANNASLKVEVSQFAFDGVDAYADIPVDLGFVPQLEGEFRVVDFLPNFFDPVTKIVKTTGITYNLWTAGSFDPNAKSVDLGPIKDGDKIATLSRYYVLRATFATPATQTFMRTPLLKDFNLAFPENPIAGISSLQGFSSRPLPFSAGPSISKYSISSSKLDPRNHLSKAGTMNLTLIDLDGEMTQFATRQNLHNIQIQAFMGHWPETQSKSDMIKLFSGVIADYSYREGELALKIEDRTKNLDIKIPSKSSAKKIVYGQTGGVVNAYSIAFSPPETAYVNLKYYFFKPHVTNTGASTLKVDALAALSIKKETSAGTFVDVSPDDLSDGRSINVQYLFAQNAFILKDAVPLGSGLRRDFRGMELLKVLGDLISNDAFISRRWIDLDPDSSVSAYLKGSDAASLWTTDRIITKPEEAKNLIKEILELIGCYLVTREDGIMTLIRWPRSITPADTWDETILGADDSQPDGLARSIVNQCLVGYDPTGNRDQQAFVIFANPDAQNAWSPGSDMFLSDRIINAKKDGGWLGPENGRLLAARIAEREVKAKANGNAPYRCRTSIDRFKVQIGDEVLVTSPSFLRKYQLGMVAKAFMVVDKNPDIENGTISWTLIESIDVNRKPTASFTVNASASLPPFDPQAVSTSVDPDGVIVLTEWDFDFDGVNFTTDATGTTPAHIYQASAIGFKTIAIRVTDDNGATDIATQIIRVIGPPVASFTAKVSAPTQPLFVSVFSNSRGVSSGIALEEWDLNYDGVTFSPTATGHSAQVNLPYQSVRIALRVTDEDGQTAITSQTFTGKTFAPAQVTGFFTEQSDDKIMLNWAANADPDISGYVVRVGASWTSSTLISNDIKTTHFVTSAPAVPGLYNYMIKAVNTTGRQSITETSSQVNILEPGDREIIHESTEPSSGQWLGAFEPENQNVVFDVAGSRWWINSTDDFTDTDTTVTDTDTRVTALSGTITSGLYHAISTQFSAIIKGRITVSATVDIIPDPEGTTITLEIRTSNDNVVWTAWGPAKQSDLLFRFLEVRAALSNDDGASNIALTGVTLRIDAKRIFKRGHDIPIAASGVTSILFPDEIADGKVFRNLGTNKVLVIVEIQNMTVGAYVNIENITNTGFDASMFRTSDNVQIAGFIDYSAGGN